MTQTAVEWLYEQIQKDQYSDALSPLEWIKVIEQAKQMEKEQKKEEYLRGYKEGIDSASTYYSD